MGSDGQNEDELIAIRWYTDIILANIDKSKLESEGIECFLHDENIGGLNFMYAFAVNGIKLKVRRRDASEADRLLLPGSDEADVDPESICPHCGSSGTGYYNHRHGFVNAASLFLMGFPLLFPGRGYRCGVCGKKVGHDRSSLLSVIFILFLVIMIVFFILRMGGR